MTKLKDIPIRVEFDRPKKPKPDFVKLVLRSILDALRDYLETGTTQSIDLRQMPRMSAEVYQELKDALMQGEVSAVIQAQVRVEVTETRYPGVWWLRYCNEQEETSTEIIEITQMPVILMPHRVDVLAGSRQLEERLRIGSLATESTAAVP